jgi:hypothetical protein
LPVFSRRQNFQQLFLTHASTDQARANAGLTEGDQTELDAIGMLLSPDMPLPQPSVCPAFPQAIANTSENTIFKRNHSSDSLAPIKAIYLWVGKFE